MELTIRIDLGNTAPDPMALAQIAHWASRLTAVAAPVEVTPAPTPVNVNFGTSGNGAAAPAAEAPAKKRGRAATSAPQEVRLKKDGTPAKRRGRKPQNQTAQEAITELNAEPALPPGSIYASEQQIEAVAAAVVPQPTPQAWALPPGAAVPPGMQPQPQPQPEPSSDVSEEDVRMCLVEINKTRPGLGSNIMRSRSWPDGTAKTPWFTTGQIPPEFRGRVIDEIMAMAASGQEAAQ